MTFYHSLPLVLQFYPRESFTKPSSAKSEYSSDTATTIPIPILKVLCISSALMDPISDIHWNSGWGSRGISISQPRVLCSRSKFDKPPPVMCAIAFMQSGATTPSLLDSSTSSTTGSTYILVGFRITSARVAASSLSENLLILWNHGLGRKDKVFNKQPDL